MWEWCLFMFVCLHICFVLFMCICLLGDRTSKTSLSRTLDVYDLQELSDEPDPVSYTHLTLPTTPYV